MQYIVHNLQSGTNCLFLLQYFGELLLLFHRMEGVELNWKVKTVFLIFAPCTQLTFLGAYIYFWMHEKSGEKEVGIKMLPFFA